MSSNPAKRPSSKSGAHVHILVAKTAQDMTRVLYGAMMENNAIYKKWREDHEGMSPRELEDAYVKKYWNKAIPGARATLAHMLTLPGDDSLKDEISEALILDKQLVKGRASGVKMLG